MDDSADLSEFTPTAQYAPENNDYSSSSSDTSGGFAALQAGASNIMDQLGITDTMDSLFGSSSGNVGDIGAPTLQTADGVLNPGAGTPSQSGFIERMLSALNDPKNAKTVDIGAGLLKGLALAPVAYANMQSQKKMAQAAATRANAEALTASTNADIARQKMRNASAIGQTNFGAPQGLIYHDVAPPTRRLT